MIKLQSPETRLIKKLRIFENLEESELSQILSIIQKTHYEKSYFLCQQDYPCFYLWILLQGNIQASMNRRPIPAIHFSAGSLIGEIEFFQKTPCLATIQTLSDCTTLKLSVQDLQQLLQRNPQMGLKIYQSFTTETLKKLNFITKELLDFIDSTEQQVLHDIRSPLAALKIITQEKNKNEPLLYSVIQRIEQLMATVFKKQSFTPLTPIHDWIIDFKRLLDEKKAQYQTLTHLQIKTNIPQSFKNNLKIFLDSFELQRMLSNLIDNSIQEAMLREKRKKIIIHFNIKLKKSYLEISLKDNGPGVSSKNLKNIQHCLKNFLPIFSKKHERPAQGLSYAYQKIKDWGGKIKIESKVNKNFSIILKLKILS